MQANRGGSKGAGRRRYQYLNDSPVGCALRSAATSTYGYGTARLLYVCARQWGQTRHSESSGRAEGI